MSTIGPAVHGSGPTSRSTSGTGRRRFPLVVGAAAIALLAVGCASDSSATQPHDTIPGSPPESIPTESTDPTTTSSPPVAEQSTTTAAPTTETTTAPSTAAPSTDATVDEGQDTPIIIDWAIEVDSADCAVSDLPGSPGGEAVVPASWAAGNADYVQFVVDGDLRPANMVRDVRGPGNIQVPCDPALNDGHEVIIVAYAGTPGDPGDPVEGPRLLVTTTATVDNGQ